jgi:hypothetical protein
MADFGLDTLSDAELGQLAAHVAAASADARAQAGSDMTDAQRDEINTIEMDAQEQWLRDREEVQGMNEPAAGYDDGENQAIPGGGREAFLKAKPERNPAYYTEIGHDPDRVKDSYMFVVGKDGRMRVVRVSDLQDIVSKNVDKHVETDRKGREVITYTLPGSQYDITYYTNDDGSINMDDLTHNDWEMATSVGSSQIWKNSIAFGRVEVRDGKPIIALGGLGYAHEGMTTEQIRSTVREAVEKAIKDGQITGANQRAVALDFSGSDGNGFDSGSPGAFEPGADYGDKRRRFAAGVGQGNMNSTKVRQIAEKVFGRDVVAGLVESGILTFVDTPADAMRLDPDISAAEAYSAAGWAINGRAIVISSKIRNEGDVKALILHEVGQHLGLGDHPKLVRDIFNDMVKAANEGNPVARAAVLRASWAMLQDGRYSMAIADLGNEFSRFVGMDLAEFMDANSGMSNDELQAFMDKVFEPILGEDERIANPDEYDRKELSEYERRAFRNALVDEVGAYIHNIRAENPESIQARNLWQKFIGFIRRHLYRMSNGRIKLGSFTDADVEAMAIAAVKRQAERGKSNEGLPIGKRFSIKNRLPGETNKQAEARWANEQPSPGSAKWVEEFNERKKAGADGREEMGKLKIPTEIELSDGTKFPMPDDFVQAWNDNASQSTGEGFEATDVEDPTKVERLNTGARKIAKQAYPGQPVNPGSEMMINGKPVFKNGIKLLKGKKLVMQFGNQLGSADQKSGYGFQHGSKHAMEIIFSHAIKTMKPGETELDALNRLTNNGTTGVQAYAEALNYFYENADVKVVVKDASGTEIKLTIVDSKSGIMINARPTSDGSYAFTTAFHMAKPSGVAGQSITSRFNNGKYVREDMAKRDAGEGIETEAEYIIKFDVYDRLFQNKAPAGSTVEVDASMAPEPMRIALQKAVDKSTQNAPAGKETRISINTEAQTSETADAQAEAVSDATEQMREPSVSEEVGGSVESPAPTYPPVIPPSQPPAAPPGAAPVNPELTAAQKAWDIVTGRYFSGISVKAHQNARRFPGASIQAVADMIHNRPGSQGSAAPRSIPASIMTARGKYMNRFRDIMEPMRNHLAAMKDTATREAFYEKLTDIITGRRTDSGFVGQMADDLKKLLADLHQYRIDAGEELGEVPDYFPAVYNSTMIAADRAGFLADAERAYRIELSKTLSGPELDATAAASALALYNTHVRGMGAEQFNMLFERSAPGGRENSAREREFGRQAQNIMRRWQAKDPFLVVSRYVAGAVKSAELARKFGADGTVGWQKYAEGMEAEGVPHEVIQEMRDLVCQAAGVSTPSIGKRGQEFMDFVALYTAATSLGKSFLSNLFEPVSVGIRTGSPLMMIRAYGETWSRSINEFLKDKAIVGMLHQDSFWQQYGEHIGTIHNSLEDAWMTTHSMELGMDNQNPRMRFLTNRIYKANLMDATETAKQQASHAIGHNYISDLCAMIDGNHWMNKFGMDASRSARQDLIELGVPEADHQAFISWIKALKAAPADQRFAIMTDGSPMSKLYEEAQVRFTNQTAVRANRAHRPVFQDNLMGKMFLQLQSFSYSYAAEANSRIYDNLKRSASTGDYTAVDRVRLIAPALMLPFAIVAFGAMFKLRRELYPTEASIKHENDPWWAKFLDAASYAGVFGPKIEQAMKFVMRDQPPGGVTGQHAINAARAVKGYATAAIGPDEKYDKAMASANKAAVKAVIPPLKGVAVAGASLANPTLGTVVQMGMNDTTLSNAAIEATQPEKPDKKREEPNPYKHRQPPRNPGK